MGLSQPTNKILFVFSCCLFPVNSLLHAEKSQGSSLSTQTQALAQRGGQNSANNEEQNNTGKKKRSDEYNFEIFATLDYKKNQGSLKTSEDKTEDFNRQTIEFDFMAGALLGNSFEPVLEVSYLKQDVVVGNFVSAGNNMSFGGGFLFNVPLISDYSTAETPKSNITLLSHAKIIPYGGFLINSSTMAESSKFKNEIKIGGSELRSRLIFGLRYMLFKHFSLNMWVKVGYEKSQSRAEESAEKTGGDMARFIIDARLLSFSLLF